MKYIKAILISIMFFIVLMLLCNNTYAANSQVTVSNSNPKVGDVITVTISGNAASWNVNLNSSGPATANGVTSFSNATESGENENVTIGRVNYTITGAGPISFSLSGQLVNGDYSSVNATGSASVQATAPVQPTPTPPPTTKPTPVTPTFSNVNETVYATLDVNVRSSYSTSSSSLGQLKKGESVTRTGISSTSANGYVWSKVTYNGKTGYIASNFLTKTKPETPPSTEPSTPPSTSPDEKSNDATLKSLSITGVQISPEFASNVTSYTANVEEDVTQAEVLAVANSEKAKVEITGNDNLQNGENTIVVKVTAEDGTVNNYEIKLTVGKIEKPLIAVMGIKENDEKIELVLENPVTTSEGYIEYTINLAEWLKSIEILENRNDENIVYVGTGTYDLIAGENSYIVIVRVPQDGAQEESIHYMLKINNPAKVVLATEENKIDYKLIAIIGAGVLFVIIVITAIVVHNKKKNDLDYGETDYSFLRDDEDIQSKEKDRKQEFLDNFSNNDDDDKRRGGKHF